MGIKKIVLLENVFPDLQVVLNALSSRANEIVSHIPNFYEYVYGSSSNHLENGGNNMFSRSGMQVLLLLNHFYVVNSK